METILLFAQMFVLLLEITKTCSDKCRACFVNDSEVLNDQKNDWYT